MRQFDRGVQAPQYAFKKATRETPDYASNLITLLVFAVGFGFVVFCAWLLLAWGTESAARSAGVAGGVAILVGLAIVMLIIVKQDVMWSIETITGHDLDGDGYYGPPPQVNEFNVQVSERTSWRASLPAPEHVIREWATAALNGGSLSYASWQRQFSTRPNFGDGAERYRLFRQALVGAEWAVEQGTHSIALTDRGQQALEEWLVQHPDPIPLLEA